MTDRCDVAIIGSGPAGLAAAIELRRNGVEKVVVLEREAQTGGVPRHCAHPPFGLREFGRILTGPAYADCLSERARFENVDLRLRHSVVALGPGGLLDIATPDGPSAIVARRVILATGTRETPRSARFLSGSRPIGVINTGALQAYVNLHRLIPFRRPLVVGSEMVSLSSLATCLTHGIRPAALVESNPGPTARWPLNLFPRLIGVAVHYQSQVAEIIGTDRVEAARIIDRRSGSDVLIDCDGILLTGGFVPEASLVRASSLEWDPATGGPVIDQDGRCSDPAYFAAGNLLRPVETAGWSFREGRRLGRIVAQDLQDPAPTIIRRIPIRIGEGLKYAIPQCVSVRSHRQEVPLLQLRVIAPLKGKLILTSDGQPIASNRLASKPERRILFRPSGAAVTSQTKALALDVRR